MLSSSQAYREGEGKLKYTGKTPHIYSSGLLGFLTIHHPEFYILELKLDLFVSSRTDEEKLKTVRVWGL
jgi:hypothetical protein